MTTFRTVSSEPSTVVVSPLAQLQQATKEYVAKERTRLGNEAKALEAILAGRTGGQGIQSVNTTLVAAVARKDIASYLSGA
jgi:hypothetical protein